MFTPVRIEEQLIVACAKPLGYKSTTDVVFDATSINWSYALELASHHRVSPLLHYFLNHNPAISVPEEVSAILRQHASEQAIANIFQTQELIRVLNVLKDEKLEAIPFKGPVLGEYLYQNLGMRPFGDLDILIRKEQFSEVKAVLIAAGYQAFRKFSPEEEARFIDTQMGFEFVRYDEQSVIEVHWSFLNAVHSFTLSIEDVWREKEELNLAGNPVCMFSPAHLMVYLCAHGSKSLWARMRWLCDVAELIARHQETAYWQEVLQIAKASKGLRMLHTGLFLAHELLEAPVPADVLKQVKKDKKAGELAEKVIKGYFPENPEKLQKVNPVTFHLDLQEKFRDRIPYYKHLFKIWTSPSSKDRAFVTLPRHLEFLYLFLKPIRMIMKRGS